MGFGLLTQTGLHLTFCRLSHLKTWSQGVKTMQIVHTISFYRQGNELNPGKVHQALLVLLPAPVTISEAQEGLV